jgi:hydroxymethylglutaryl-CoA synthase
MGSATNLMNCMGVKPQDYNYAIFHQPNGKFPLKAAQMLGFTKEQVKQGLLSPYIGNTYSGASMLGLASVLDVAKPRERIFVTSYGSGAGSDSFDITVTDEIKDFKKTKAPLVSQLIEKKQYIDYATYAKFRDLLYWE